MPEPERARSDISRLGKSRRRQCEGAIITSGQHLQTRASTADHRGAATRASKSSDPQPALDEAWEGVKVIKNVTQWPIIDRWMKQELENTPSPVELTLA